MYTFITKKLDINNPPREGSVMFMENTVPRPIDGIMEWITKSPLSHVAILLKNQVGLNTSIHLDTIYEAYPPCVRKVSFHQYLDEVLSNWENKRWTRRLGGLNTFWWEPSEELDKGQLISMRNKAESLIGVKYNMIRNYFFGAKNRIHCSQFVGEVLDAGGLILSDKNRETPGSLYRKLLELNV